MKYKLSIAVLLCAVVLTPTAFAATFKGADQLTLSDPIEDDLYAAAGEMTISSSIKGDAIVAGGEIDVSGEIQEDLTIVGGKVVVAGTVLDDVRAAGGELRFSGVVDDDLFVAGGTVVLTETSIVKGDVRIGGGDVYINGTINGNLQVHATRVVLRGTVNGQLTINANTTSIHSTQNDTSTIVSESIYVGDTALFTGQVRYWQRQGTMDFAPYTQNAEVIFDKDLARLEVENRNKSEKFDISSFIRGIIFSSLFAAFFIVVLAFVTKKTFPDAAKVLSTSFWQQTLYGFLYFVLMPVFSALLFITVLGIPFSILSGVVYGFSIYFARPLSSMVLARYLEQKYKYKWNTWSFIGVSLSIFIGMKVLSEIPFVGWLICIILVFAAYGALFTTKWDKFKKIR